jgi:hypothetical protein
MIFSILKRTGYNGVLRRKVREEMITWFLLAPIYMVLNQE